MNELTNFNDNQLPAYLRNEDSDETNKDLLIHDTGSLPSLSIRGKQFRIVRGTEETIITNPADPRSPASYINVILLKVPNMMAKTYYDVAYDANAVEPPKPVCFSNTGIIPDASVENPCSSNCKICPKNAYGSAVVDGVSGKGKACRDNLRIAVASLDNLKDPLLLRVPPTSIKEVVKLGHELKARKVPYTAVLVEISFDPNSVAQKLVFKPIALVSESQHQEIKEIAKSELVAQITGLTEDVLNYAGATHEQTVTQVAPEIAKSVAVGTVTPSAVKEANIATPVSKQTVEPTIITSKELKGLDNLHFDD